MSKDAEKIVEKGWQRFRSACDDAALLIKDKVEFEFSIGYQPSDGPMIEYGVNVAPLGKCVGFIKTHGKLTLEDFFLLSI